MNKKHVLAVLLSLALCLGLLAGCGSGTSSTGSTFSNAGTTEPQTYAYTAEDLEGLVSGLGDVAVIQGSERVDLKGLVSWDDSVIQDVTLETGLLDFSTQSNVTVTWSITADAGALAQHLGVDFDGEAGETVTVSQTTRVYVIPEAQAADFQTRHPEVPIYGSDNTPYDPATAQSQEEIQLELQQPETAQEGAESQGSNQGETGGEAKTSSGDSSSTGGSSGSTTGSATETGTSGGTTQPSQPEHQHVWHDHIAQRWVENIVTVPDYETQKIPVGTNFIFSYDKFTTSDIEEAKAHAVELIYAGLPDNYRTETIYETQTVQVGSHEEDQGWYEDYVDYQYCDCGAIR